MTHAVVVAALLLFFAVFVTAHVVIAVRLLTTKPRYRGLVALVVLPLAPMWAYRERWKKLCWLWVGSIAGYTASVAAASFV